MDGFPFGSVTTVDIAIASFSRSAGFACYAIDAQRWPKTAAFVLRTLALPSFEKLKRYEDVVVSTPVHECRARLQPVGAPLTATILGTSTPRRGIMPV